MFAGGFPLDREEEHPHVYWSVPRHWFPGGLLIKREEVPELLRLLGRLPRSTSRERLLQAIVERIPHAAAPAPIVAPDVTAREDRYLAVIEDSARAKIALRLRYYSVGRGAEETRHASVHTVLPGPPARFVATCHRSGKLKWFRVENVSDAELDPEEAYRSANAGAVETFLAESIDGYHGGKAPETLTFFVRDPESRWVARNLETGMKADVVPGGIRVNVKTSALLLTARFVVQLGDAARAETPALAAKVAEIASGALRNART